MKKYGPLDRWQFTDTVVIDDSDYSHSHPVLTIGCNSKSTRTDLGLLSVDLHEQMHWFVSKHPRGLKLAIGNLRAKYPRVKVGRKQGGARDTESTYLHLLVCFLELEVLTKVVGAKRARRLVLSKKYYRWIYKTVVADYDDIEAIATRRGVLA